MAGVGYNTMVVPARALGKCGGYDSDIIAAAAMGRRHRRAAGVPANLHPARVINMSLGGAGRLHAGLRRRVHRAAQQGRGRRGRGRQRRRPAGGARRPTASRRRPTPTRRPIVIAVAGLRHAGTKVGFSDIGPRGHDRRAGRQLRQHRRRRSPCLYPILTARQLRHDDAGRQRRHLLRRPQQRQPGHQLLDADGRGHGGADAVGRAEPDQRAGHPHPQAHRAAVPDGQRHRAAAGRSARSPARDAHGRPQDECICTTTHLRRRHARRRRGRDAASPSRRRDLHAAHGGRLAHAASVVAGSSVTLSGSGQRRRLAAARR